jgi:glutamine amidotransferase
VCRLLAVCAQEPFELERYLEPFAEIARTSTEYQGHGWGCGWMTPEGWHLYHDIAPVWEDPSPPRGRTRLLVAHARSAFRDEGIEVRNNMPFTDGRSLFVFNGELRGVRLKESGRIGAEKVFNFIRRFDRGDMAEAMRKGLAIVERRTRYVRAMNIIIADAEAVRVTNRFNDSPSYFQMHVSEDRERLVVCSDPLPAGGVSGASLMGDWQPLATGEVHTFRTGKAGPDH